MSKKRRGFSDIRNCKCTIQDRLSEIRQDTNIEENLTKIKWISEKVWTNSWQRKFRY